MATYSTRLATGAGGYNKEYDSCESYEAYYDATRNVFCFYSNENECYVTVEPKYIMELPSDPEE